MASPTSIVNRAEPGDQEQKQLELQELLESLAQHKKSVQSLLTVIQDLDKSGILDILHAILNAKEQVATIVLEQILKPSVLSTVKNAMTAVGLVSQIDSDQLSRLTEALVAGLQSGQENLEANKRVGLFDLLRTLKDPGTQRTLSLALGVLHGVGEKL